MSVSARAASMTSEIISPMEATAIRGGRAESVFVTPRVIDQSAFDDLSDLLRELVSRAEETGEELKQRMNQVSGAKQEQDKLGERLQEQLRLSARMLKAFQTQIARTESATHDLASREERAIQAVEEKHRQFTESVEQTIERFQTDFDARMNASLERIDREMEARAGRLHELTEKIDELKPTIEKLQHVAEHAEVAVSTAAYRAAAATVELTQRGERAEAMMASAEAVTARLEDDLLTSAQHIDEFSEKAASISQQLSTACERGETAQQALNQQIDSARTVSHELAIDVQACEALESLIDELRPWHSLVLERTREEGGVRLPAPAARLLDELRTRVDHELDEFSTVLAQVADQFRRFAGRDHVRREVRELDARDDCGETNATPASDGGDEGVVSIVKPASPLSFSSHSSRAQSR